MKFRITLFGHELFAIELVKSTAVTLTVDSAEEQHEVGAGSSGHFEKDIDPRYPEDRYTEYYINRPFGFSG